MSALRGIGSILGKILPWVITLAALYYAFNGIDVGVLTTHLHEANFIWILGAILLTSFSYLFRARRWQKLFPAKVLSFADAARVLLLGFFMNNVLPARAGEFVRAHMGAKLSGESRTLVLATIASERLVDGLTISVMFVLFALGMGDAGISQNLLIVAYLFLAVAVAVLIVVVFRSQLLALVERLTDKINHPASRYAVERIRLFVHGLSPLSSRHNLPRIVFWSTLIWGIELLVYVAIAEAYSADLSWAACVLFLVAVNFSSLIPAAPGGIGVIEAVTSAVLVSIGIEREHALTMVITQHIIQYAVVGVPGAIILFRWKKYSPADGGVTSARNTKPSSGELSISRSK